MLQHLQRLKKANQKANQLHPSPGSDKLSVTSEPWTKSGAAILTIEIPEDYSEAEVIALANDTAYSPNFTIDYETLVAVMSGETTEYGTFLLAGPGEIGEEIVYKDQESATAAEYEESAINTTFEDGDTVYAVVFAVTGDEEDIHLTNIGVGHVDNVQFKA